jgi:hypothetical protein
MSSGAAEDLVAPAGVTPGVASPGLRGGGNCESIVLEALLVVVAAAPVVVVLVVMPVAFLSADAFDGNVGVGLYVF